MTSKGLALFEWRLFWSVRGCRLVSFDSFYSVISLFSVRGMCIPCADSHFLQN
jgi:hypothetical protein